MTLANHASKRMCEFNFILPTLTHYLEHIFLIKHSGYEYDHPSGRIKSMGRYIDTYKKLTEKQWEDLIAKCCLKEKASLFQRKNFHKHDPSFNIEKTLESACAGYVKYDIKDEDFSKENLYQNLVHFKQKQEELIKTFGVKIYIRLKMIEEDCLLSSINKSTNKYLKGIALNFIDAWTEFLKQEILTNNCENTIENYASLENTQKQIDFLAKQRSKIIV